MPRRFILFNGPPRCGKDAGARHLYEAIPESQFERFSFPNKLAFAAITESSCDRFGNNHLYDPIKEDILPSFGVSYRQWQIDFSEEFMKPCYGDEIFGRMLIARCRDAHGLYIVADCGFQVEVDCLTAECCLLFTIKRDGCDFNKDSREYVKPHPTWTHYTIYNNGSLEDYQNNVLRIARDWLGSFE